MNDFLWIMRKFCKWSTFSIQSLRIFHGFGSNQLVEKVDWLHVMYSNNVKYRFTAWIIQHNERILHRNGTQFERFLLTFSLKQKKICFVKIYFWFISPFCVKNFIFLSTILLQEFEKQNYFNSENVFQLYFILLFLQDATNIQFNWFDRVTTNWILTYQWGALPNTITHWVFIVESISKYFFFSFVLKGIMSSRHNGLFIEIWKNMVLRKQ